MRRRNADDELRRLERDARRGDPQAAERLRAARIRTTGVVPESHRIGMAMVGVFTPTGAVLCVPCDERSGEARPGLRMEHSSDEASNARCDHCGLPVFVRDDVALLQNLRDELRAVHGIDMWIWQTGGMCASLVTPVAGADIMIGVQRAGNLYILDDDRIVAHDRDQPAEYRWREFGIPYGTMYGEAPTGMLEWYVGAVDEGGEEIDEVMSSLTITTRTVGEAAHLIARHMRRAGVVRNPRTRAHRNRRQQARRNPSRDSFVTDMGENVELKSDDGSVIRLDRYAVWVWNGRKHEVAETSDDPEDLKRRYGVTGNPIKLWRHQ